MESSTIETIRNQLKHRGCPRLAALFSDQQMETVLTVPSAHKRHPLALVLQSATASGNNRSKIVTRNVETSLRFDPPTDWLETRKNVAAASNIENSSAALGEIRAYGLLASIGKVIPVKHASHPTPDFALMLRGEDAIAESHTKQMNSDEAEIQDDFIHNPPPGHMFGGVRFTEGYIAPAKRPNKGENVGENVAQKFAAIKQKNKQAAPSVPSLLVLDLQDEDWWVADAEGLEPMTLWNDSFFSVGFWHAFYGKKGCPILEHTRAADADLGNATKMKHDGRFMGTTGSLWAAAIISFPSATAIFENPNAVVSLTSGQRDALIELPYLNWDKSWMDYPAQSKLLAHKIDEAHAQLADIWAHASREV
jgi:hypothetical protein